MNDHFRVSVGVEVMAAFLEFAAQFWKVVDFAIENHPDTSVLVENWLVPSSQIDDAKAAHTEARAIFDENAFVIRTAVHNSLAHAVNRGCFNSLVGSRAYDSGDSAHALSPPAHLGICALAELN